jgi:hypothetical protein
MRLRGISRCVAQPDLGYGRSQVDACWQTPDSRFVGVVRGFSPEPTLLRTDLAERTANLVCAAMLDEWTRDPTSDVEARLRGVFEAVHRRVRDEARSVVEWPGPPAGQTVFSAHAHAAALAVDGDAVHVAHVGSCRVFASREGAWSQLTRDHTLAEEYASCGATAPELPVDFQGIYTRFLGFDETACEPTLARHSIDDGPFLVCTASVGIPPRVGDLESMLAALEHSQGALVIVAASSPATAAGRTGRASGRPGE